MKVLLDENLSPLLRRELSDHVSYTAVYLGWAGLKNGELLRQAEAASFEVLITADQSLTYQQNLEGRRVAIVVLTSPNWVIIKEHLSEIRAAVDRAVPGSFQMVECGRFRRS